jgi:uncharacterized repeat protein (TIGR03803 family)
VAGLVALDQVLYGTTEFGGVRTRLCSTGCGTIFTVSASGVEKILYRFPGGKPGAMPVAALLRIHGLFYGTAQYGGMTTSFCSTGCGTVFRIDASGAEKTLYAYRYSPSSKDGAFPAAGLIAVGGQLYGTTLGGGLGRGTVFKVNPSSGAESVVHGFSCCTSSQDGAYPLARLTAVSGVLYGTTSSGGAAQRGTVFRMTTTGSETVLHSFTGKPDGTTPDAGLIFSGALYGTTKSGGTHSEGTVFTQSP